MIAQEHPLRVVPDPHKRTHPHMHLSTCMQSYMHTKITVKTGMRGRSGIHARHLCAEQGEKHEVCSFVIWCYRILPAAFSISTTHHNKKRSVTYKSYAVNLSVGCSWGSNFWNPLILITEMRNTFLEKLNSTPANLGWSSVSVQVMESGKS